MNYEQPDLFADTKIANKPDKERIDLEKRIRDFLGGRRISRTEEIGALQLQGLVMEFCGKASDEELTATRKIFAKILLSDGFILSEAVIRGEIRGEEGVRIIDAKEKGEGAIVIVPSDMLSPEEIRKIRNNLPPHQRGIPTGDL